MATQPVSFGSINGELDLANTNPITINDTLVRALTGNSSVQTTRSPISFADLSGKVGVAPVSGATSNTQASYFNPTISSLGFSFDTDIYNPQVVWSTTLPNSVVFSSNGLNATASLSRTSVGTTSVNGSVTAALSYGNTFIGSNTVNVSLSSQVYNPDIQFVNSPSQNLSLSGFSAQTASVSVSLTSNVAGTPSIVYSVSPMDSGVLITSNGVILTSYSPTVTASANVGTYKVTATVSLGSNIVTTGSETVVVSSQRFSNTFTLNTSGSSLAYSNTYPARPLNSTFTATGNAPISTISWSSNTISGSASTLTPNGANATLSISVGNTSVPYTGVTSQTAVTAYLLDATHGNNVVASQSYTVTLSGLISGLQVGPITANTTASGYTAQTAVFQTYANVQFGTLSWVAQKISGSGTYTTNSPVTGPGTANAQIVTTQSTVGSNSSSWSLYPTISQFGLTFFSAPPTSTFVTATMTPSAPVTISGPTSNVVVANSGVVPSSVSLVASNVGAGTAVIWNAALISGNAATFSSNGLSASLTLVQSGNGYSYSSYSITANCYDVSSGTSLSAATQNVSLESGVFGASVSIPSANIQSGYTAQTATSTCSATFGAGTGIWSSSNPNGISPSTRSSTPTAAFSVGQSTVGTNTQSYPLSLLVYDTNSTLVATLGTGTYSTSLTSQVNSYSLSSSSYVNTQIVTSPSGNSFIVFTPSSNVPGGTFSNWSLSSQTGALISSNTSAAVVSYDMSQNLSASNPGFSYNTNVSFDLLDQRGRLITSSSNAVTLRSYYANPTISFSGTPNVSGFVAQTASSRFTCSIVGSAGANLVFSSWSGASISIGTASSNSTYYSLPYSISQSSIGSVSSTASFNMTISYYGVNYSIPTQSQATSATFYNPALVATPSSGSTAGFISAQTAWAVITASCNSAIPSQTWTWGGLNTTSGGFTGSYLQGTGNNQYVAYCSATGIGTVAGSGYPGSLNLYSSGQYIATIGCPTVSASATLYNPALVISGPGSASTSNLFESVASLTLSASANASIPSVSYVSSVGLVSGSAASVSITNANTDINFSLDAVHQSLGSTYSVNVNVYCQGTLIQTAAKTITLNASGTVPNYYASSPANVSTSGWNFAQTASQVVTMNGMTGSGEYVTWNYTLASGSNPSFSWPGGANSSITTTVSAGSIGTVSSTGNMLGHVYDPVGRLMISSGTGNYTVSATVLNPGMSVTNGSTNVNQGTSVATGESVGVVATVSATNTGQPTGGGVHYSFSMGTQTLTQSNVVSPSQSHSSNSSSYTISAIGTSPMANNATYSLQTSASYSVSLIYNNQTIAGPVTGQLSAKIYGTTKNCVAFGQLVKVRRWFLPHYIFAENVKVGDLVKLAGRKGWSKVTESYPGINEVCCVECENGCHLVCSVNANLLGTGGEPITASDSSGSVLWTESGNSQVHTVTNLGLRSVQKITASNVYFVAQGIGHHNLKGSGGSPV